MKGGRERRKGETEGRTVKEGRQQERKEGKAEKGQKKRWGNRGQGTEREANPMEGKKDKEKK
jgi:hypothetical protein